MKRPEFTASKYEFGIIQRLATRMQKAAKHAEVDFDMTSSLMDFEACHCNGNPLDLQALLDSDDFTFCHDAFGIRRHIDRNTGILGDCFSPRCSLPEMAF